MLTSTGVESAGVGLPLQILQGDGDLFFLFTSSFLFLHLSSPTLDLLGKNCEIKLKACLSAKCGTLRPTKYMDVNCMKKECLQGRTGKVLPACEHELIYPANMGTGLLY